MASGAYTTLVYSYTKHSNTLMTKHANSACTPARVRSAKHLKGAMDTAL